MSKLPAVIGRYQVLNRIGQGGMGYLFLAWDPVLERQVAIKRLRDDNDELRERFAREARSVARLRHPNIVTIYDVGEQDGEPFIAMEYIIGQTLAEIIRSATPIELTRTLQYFSELCDGLGFAHKAGIVHRDVKPANVIVEPEGSIKILDFGIARVAESGMTQAGMIIGTLNYMSPEQVAGTLVDSRSDIFAVGALLYELLTYRQAFPGGLHNGILNKILHEQPPPLATACPGLDPDVIRVVERALQKEPADRYQDLASMRKDLDRIRLRIEANPVEAVVVMPVELPPLNEDATTASSDAQYAPGTTDRAEIARQKEVFGYLDDAYSSLAAGNFDAASAAARQALQLDPELAEAVEVQDRVRAAREERQINDWLASAQNLLNTGSLTEAQILADQALTVAPGLPAAVQLGDAIEAARKQREKDRQRAEALRAALDRANALFEKASLQEAEGAVSEALSLAGDSDEALSLEARVRQALEEQRQQAFERRVDDILRQAAVSESAGRLDEALAALRSFSPEHSRVAAAVADIAGKKARADREREEARRREESSARALEAARALESHEQAVALLKSAQVIDPQHSALRQALATRQEALTRQREEERLARERQKQIEAALAKAHETRPHEAAIAALKEAQRIDPQHQELRRAIELREAALTRQREEERLARERQQKIEAALAKAQATSSHEVAVAVLKEAQRIDPQHQELRRAIELREAALTRQREEERLARERQEQIEASIASASRTPSHEAALDILRGAQKLDPAHRPLLAAIEQRESALAQEREEAERAREREKKIAEAIAKAAKTTAHEPAIALLKEAQKLDPAHKELRASVDQRESALAREREEAERAREREKKIAAAIAKAAKTTAHEPAIALLREAQTLDSAHRELRAVIEQRELALAREREEADRARERERKVAVAIARAEKTPPHEAAIAILNEALIQAPQHVELTRLIVLRRAALAEEQRQKEERQRQITAAIASARAMTSHEAAVAALKQARALDPNHPELRRALEERQAALEIERAEQQRAAARQEAIAAGLAKASRTPSHQAAVNILQELVAIDPGHVELRERLQERITALEQEREAARQARIRQEQVAKALATAKSAKSHADAIVALTHALSIDPTDRNVRALLDARNAAVEQEREEEARRQALAAARERIFTLIKQHDFDTARRLLDEAERAFPAKRLKDLRKELAYERAAIVGPQGGPGRMQWAGLGIAALIVLAAGAGYLITRPEPPSAPAEANQQSIPASEVASRPAPAPDINAPGGAAPGPAPAEVPPAPDPGAPPAVTPPPAANPQVLQRARQLATQGNLTQAAAIVVEGLKVDPSNQDLRALGADIVGRARGQASKARAAATQRGDVAIGTAPYRDAERRTADAQQHERAGRYDQAARSLLEAEGLFARAAKATPEAPPQVARTERATPPPEEAQSKPVQPSLPSPAESQPPAKPTPPATAPPSTTTPTPNTTAAPPNSTAAAPNTTPPPSQAASDEEGVRAALRAYEQAYTNRDVNAVTQVYPSVNAGALKRSFDDLRQQEVSISCDQITITGTTANATCQVRQSIVPRAGSGRTDVVRSLFRLQKAGTRWIIVERRGA